VTSIGEEALANFVPAAAVIRGEQALSKMIWRKGGVDGIFQINSEIMCL